jgi:hypothetical protein
MIMKADLERMNVTYELEFATPSFDLPASSVTVLRALYEKVHPRYPMRTQQMQVLGGSLLSDVHVRATLFSGNADIDVSVDAMSLVFNNLTTKDDLEVCQDCILLSEEALQSSLPNVSVRAVAIKPTLFLKLGDGHENASDHLVRVMGSTMKLDQAEFGNAITHPGVNLEVENSEEGWSVIFHAFRNRTRTSSLILSCQASYGAEGKVRGLENRVAHLEQLLTVFLEYIGLETPVSID